MQGHKKGEKLKSNLWGLIQASKGKDNGKMESVEGRQDVRAEAEGEEGCHHFFWGVESFCIPRILSSSSEMKSWRGKTQEWSAVRNNKYSNGRKRRGKAWGKELTSVGLKQSTSKSCKKNKTAVCINTMIFPSEWLHGLTELSPTLTLAPRSTSLGMSSNSSTSISSSGMASSWSKRRK